VREEMQQGHKSGVRGMAERGFSLHTPPSLFSCSTSTKNLATKYPFINYLQKLPPSTLTAFTRDIKHIYRRM
jgi:hypothetical protein